MTMIYNYSIWQFIHLILGFSFISIFVALSALSLTLFVALTFSIPLSFFFPSFRLYVIAIGKSLKWKKKLITTNETVCWGAKRNDPKPIYYSLLMMLAADSKKI